MFWLGDAFTIARAERVGRFEERKRDYYVYLERAGEARAEAFARTFARMGRGIQRCARTARVTMIVMNRRHDRARRMRASIHGLNVLSDHALKDIGLHRSQIPSVAAALATGRGPRWRAASAAIRSPRAQPTGAPVWNTMESGWREAA